MSSLPSLPSLRGVGVVLVLLMLMGAAIGSSVDGTQPEQSQPDAPSIVMSVVTPIPLQVRTPVTATDAVGLIPPQVATPEPTTTSPGVQPPQATEQPSTFSTAVATPAVPPTPTPVPTPVVEAPIRLRIPALGVDAVVQWVGIDDQGRMGVPDNYTDVAWYERGPRPGMNGNAVIAGHLDSQRGPAVFYRLQELRPGDEIFVTTHAGEEIRFVVEVLEAYEAENAPLERIFGPSSQPRLNLITCDGSFDWSSREYDQRLVVYAVM